MALEFAYGDASSPRGHALVYFDDSGHQTYYASYIVLLPVTVDVSKYVPPFLMNQVGDIGPGDMWYAPANVKHGGEILGDEPVVFIDVYAPPSRTIAQWIENKK